MGLTGEGIFESDVVNMRLSTRLRMREPICNWFVSHTAQLETFTCWNAQGGQHTEYVYFSADTSSQK